MCKVGSDFRIEDVRENRNALITTMAGQGFDLPAATNPVPNYDVIAGLNYLKSLPFIDPARIAISGCSYGAIQTLLAGERDLSVKALVPFTPGAMSWEQNQLLQDHLIQAAND
jgi:dienelactone hydrolase